MDSMIVSIIKKFWELYHKLMPTKGQNFLVGGREKLINLKSRTIIWFKMLGMRVMAFFPILLGKLTGFVGNFQGHFTHWIISLRSLKSKKFNLKGFLLSIVAILKAPFISFKTWYDTLSATTVAVSLTLIIASTSSLFSIWYFSGDLYNKVRGPASAEEAIEIGVRPVYYKKNEKHFTIFNLSMPLYIEGIHNPKQVKIDFTIEPSNRYIKEYFFENEYLIHDRINLMVHPIIPSLPLSEEGKVILKDKLLLELNQLIKDLKIKGKIDEIYVNSVLAV